MAAKRGSKKWTSTQVNEHIRRIQAITEKQRQGKEENFEVITPEQIRKKLARLNSPFFVSQSYNNTTPGGTVNFNCTLYNPDPGQAGLFVVHVWVGPGSADPVIGTFLLNIDTRFPRLTLPPGWPGTWIPSGGTVTLSFALKAPSTIEKTNYLANACLMYRGVLDGATYIDRSQFMFNVT